MTTTSLLKRINRGWHKRAQVRSKQMEHLESPAFDLQGKDFLEELLPFHTHPTYIQLPESVKSKILTCGWLIYNEKTIMIENQIISPACQLILQEQLPGLRDVEYKFFATETLIDESYHTLLALHGSNITKKKRRISIDIPEFELIREMKLQQSKYSNKKSIILMAFAIVSELLVTDYLRLISEANNIQEINRLTVEIHRKDELAHKKGFSQIVEPLYSSLNSSDKKLFKDMLLKVPRWFMNKELKVWSCVLEQIAVQHTQ